MRAEGRQSCQLTAIARTKTCSIALSARGLRRFATGDQPSPKLSRHASMRRTLHSRWRWVSPVVRCIVPPCERRLGHLIMRTTAIPARNATPAPFRPAPRRLRSGAETYIAGLEAKLSIGPDQMEAWRAFADTLSRKACRMHSDRDHSDEPFGPLPDRLAALASMRRAADRLFGVLHPAPIACGCAVPAALLLSQTAYTHLIVRRSVLVGVTDDPAVAAT